MKRALRVFCGVILVLVAVLALGFGVLQTGPGKSWLARAIGAALSDPQEQVTVRGIEGLVPFDFRVRAIAIADASGPRLAADDIDIAVSASDLLARRLAIRRLGIARLALLRPGQSGGAVDWQSLLHPALPVSLGALDVARIEIGAPIFGSAMTLSLHGSAAVGDGSADAKLAVQRIDGIPGSATLDAAFGLAPPHLRLDAQVSEPTGTVLASLLHRDGKLPLALALVGEGPIENWQGKLHATAGTAAALDATFRIAGSAPYRVTVAADARAASLLPADAARVLGDRIGLTTEIAVAPEQISIERLHLDAASFALDGQGRYGVANGAIAGTAQLDAPDLARLLPTLAGAGDARVTVGGTVAKPTAEAALHVAHLRAGDVSVADATAALRLDPEGDPLTAPIRVEGNGRLAGLDLGSTALPKELSDTIDWRVAGHVDARRMEFGADTIALAAHGATLDASATATPDGAAGTMRLAIPALAGFDRGALAGALDLAANFRAARDGSGTAVLSGAIDQPRSGTAQLDGLLGAHLDIAGTIARRADGTIEARDVAVDGTNVSLAGDAQRAADGTLAAHFQAKLPRLAALDPQLAGAAAVTGSVAGPPAALTGTASIEAPSLVLAGVPVEALAAKLALLRLAPLSVSLEASLRARTIAARLRAAASYENGVLRVQDASADAAGAHLEGSLRLAGDRIEGKLAGSVPDLRPWSPFAGIDLAGRARIDAQAAGNRVTATLEASSLHAGGVIVQTAKLGVHSDRPGRYAIDLAASGSAGARFALTGGASLTAARGGYDLAIAKLEGTLDDTPVGLRAPLALAWRGDTLRFTGLALHFADGSVTGAGEIARSALSLRLAAHALPVEPMSRLGGIDVTGTLGFELSVAGTRNAPQGRLVVDAEQLRFAAATRPGLPALGAVVQADWRDGRLDIKGRLAGPRDAAIGWTASAPLVLERGGLAVSMPRAGTVAAHLEGEGQLGAFSDLLPTGEDRIDGRFAIDVRVVGTVGNPDASGRITVTDGRYESLATGAILTDIGITLEGQRDRLVLRQFAARDTTGGSLSASGAVDLAAEGGPALSFAANLQRLRVLNRDEGHATASGELRLTGTVAAPRLAARLTVDEADLAVPERLPQSYRPVVATVINSATGATLSTPEAPTPSPLVTLAINVQVQSPGKTFVRGRGLDSEWRGNVQITGTAAAPIVTGRLEVIRGTYDFLGKSAVVTRGVITFYGGPTIDPTIDIEARVPSSDITAIISITGSALQPTIKLSSEPALPRDEILSRVLFGTSMSQIGPAQGLEIASAAASLAGGSGLDVLSKLRRGLGLDRLTLGQAGGSSLPGAGVPGIGATPGTGAATGLGTAPLAPGAAPGGVSGTTVSAGKYVANGVYVGVSQGLQAGSSTVTVDIDVTRHISVETQAGQANGTGLGVNWKLDY